MDDCNEDEEDKEVVYEDGGKDSAWSLVILSCAVVTQMIVYGELFCVGIYFIELRIYFHSDYQDVAIIGSISYGTKCIAALLSSILYRKFGCRPIVIAGGLISSIGCLFSYFANSLSHLYITYGLINGFGLGLAYTPTTGILPDYFEKYRYFATAFATVGSGTGTLLFQPIFLYLIETFGWHGSMLVNAGISLQIVVCGCLMRSRTVHPHTKWSDMFELSLLKNFKFIMLWLNCVFWGGACFVVFAMANSLVIPKGISVQQSTILVVITGAGNLLGRVLGAFVGHWHCLNRSVSYCLYTLMYCLATIATVFVSTYISFCVVFGLFGLFFGFMLCQVPGVIMDFFGTHRLISGFGYNMFGCGIGAMLIPPLAAMLADKTGKIEDAYIFSAACFAAAFITSGLASVVHLYQKHQLRKAQKGDILLEVDTCSSIRFK